MLTLASKKTFSETTEDAKGWKLFSLGCECEYQKDFNGKYIFRICYRGDIPRQ